MLNIYNTCRNNQHTGVQDDCLYTRPPRHIMVLLHKYYYIIISRRNILPWVFLQRYQGNTKWSRICFIKSQPVSKHLTLTHSLTFLSYIHHIFLTKCMNNLYVSKMYNFTCNTHRQDYSVFYIYTSKMLPKLYWYMYYDIYDAYPSNLNGSFITSTTHYIHVYKRMMSNTYIESVPTFNLVLSKFRSWEPSTFLLLNSGMYCSSSSAISHWHTWATDQSLTLQVVQWWAFLSWKLNNSTLELWKFSKLHTD